MLDDLLLKIDDRRVVLSRLLAHRNVVFVGSLCLGINVYLFDSDVRFGALSFRQHLNALGDVEGHTLRVLYQGWDVAWVSCKRKPFLFHGCPCVVTEFTLLFRKLALGNCHETLASHPLKELLRMRPYLWTLPRAYMRLNFVPFLSKLE